MIQRHVLIHNEQERFLKKMGNVSELIRRAIDEFIERQKNVDAATSPNKVERV